MRVGGLTAPMVRTPHPKRGRRDFSRCPRLVRELFDILERDRIALTDAADRAGVCHATISKWPGSHSPALGNFEAVVNALGYDLRLVRRQKQRQSVEDRT